MFAKFIFQTAKGKAKSSGKIKSKIVKAKYIKRKQITCTDLPDYAVAPNLKSPTRARTSPSATQTKNGHRKSEVHGRADAVKTDSTF